MEYMKLMMNMKTGIILQLNQSYLCFNYCNKVNRRKKYKKALHITLKTLDNVCWKLDKIKEPKWYKTKRFDLMSKFKKKLNKSDQK